MPLRASSFHRHELPTIIFVTDLDYIKNEWDMISTFPDIYILNVGKVFFCFCFYNLKIRYIRVHQVILIIYN